MLISLETCSLECIRLDPITEQVTALSPDAWELEVAQQTCQILKHSRSRYFKT